jgi:hypothetical protein
MTKLVLFKIRKGTDLICSNHFPFSSHLLRSIMRVHKGTWLPTSILLDVSSKICAPSPFFHRRIKTKSSHYQMRSLGRSYSMIYMYVVRVPNYKAPIKDTPLRQLLPLPSRRWQLVAWHPMIRSRGGSRMNVMPVALCST